MRPTIKVGKANETAWVGRGEIRVCDDLGLPLDPKVYAKPNCKACNGEGVVTTVRPASHEDVKRVVGDNADIAKAVADGGNVFRSMVVCGCVEPRYQKARKQALAGTLT